MYLQYQAMDLDILSGVDVQRWDIIFMKCCCIVGKITGKGPIFPTVDMYIFNIINNLNSHTCDNRMLYLFFYHYLMERFDYLI